MRTKNYCIEFFRFFFMLEIVIWHFKGVWNTNNGWVAVDFFFILSGMLMYNSVTKSNALNVIDYTWKKIKRFWPTVLICSIPTYILYIHWKPSGMPWHWTLDDTVDGISHLVSEQIFVGSTGFLATGWNSPIWYINCLIWGGAIVYSLLRTDLRVAINVYLPIISVLGLTYLYGEHSGENRPEVPLWGVKACFFGPMLKAVCEISWGVLLGKLYSMKKESLAKRHVSALNILSILSFVGMIVISMTYNPLNGRYTLVFAPILLLAAFTEQSFFHKCFSSPIWGFLGGITLEMLLAHRFIGELCKRIENAYSIDGWIVFVSNIILVVLLSCLIKHLSEKLSIILKLI